MNKKRTLFSGSSYVGFVLIAFFYIPYVNAQSLQIVSWNVESEGSDTHVLANYIQDQQGIDLWGFSEVLNEDWAKSFEDAASVGEGADFDYVLGSTGQSDRLLVVYNNQMLQVENVIELEDINILGRVRAPLVVQFKILQTGQEFLFMVNHLYRSNPQARSQQARQLNAWVQSQSLPVIAVGNYNFDWAVDNGEQNHDAGYDLLTENGVLMWLRPDPLIATHCGRHNSVLDFVFYSVAAREWARYSEILESQNSYCPDNRQKSDHRPVFAAFELQGNGNSDDQTEILQQINERLLSIEQELDAVRSLLQRLDQ
ncbi:hypothetical protein [Kaarinaea lacus]